MYRVLQRTDQARLLTQWSCCKMNSKKSTSRSTFITTVHCITFRSTNLRGQDRLWWFCRDASTRLKRQLSLSVKMDSRAPKLPQWWMSSTMLFSIKSNSPIANAWQNTFQIKIKWKESKLLKLRNKNQQAEFLWDQSRWSSTMYLTWCLILTRCCLNKKYRSRCFSKTERVTKRDWTSWATMIPLK